MSNQPMVVSASASTNKRTILRAASVQWSGRRRATEARWTAGESCKQHERAPYFRRPHKTGSTSIVCDVIINKLNLTCAFLSPLYHFKLMAALPAHRIQLIQRYRWYMGRARQAIACAKRRTALPLAFIIVRTGKNYNNEVMSANHRGGFITLDVEKVMSRWSRANNVCKEMSLKIYPLIYLPVIILITIKMNTVFKVEYFLKNDEIFVIANRSF